MLTILSLIGSSWTFFRSQPALQSVTFWLFTLPLLGTSTILRLLDPQHTERHWLFVAIVTLALLHVLMVWGSACILLIGRRLVQSRAGRNRTSFKAVRRQAARFVLPLLLTGTLRFCISLLWAILLIVPGILYYLRTSFYQVIVVIEDTSYRPGLHRSQELTSRHVLHLLLLLVGLTLTLFAPVELLSLLFETFTGTQDLRPLLLTDAIVSTLASVAGSLYLLSLIQLYGLFRDRPTSVVPPAPEPIAWSREEESAA